ncbi:MAG: leucine-rich repeat domain-containing protein [Clostridia bacterium]|nr:leucine-rich repeat domain-containing protein [Clostridia bacterium]
MSAYIIQEKTLTDIADAVREKSGTSDLILVGDLPAAISNIQTGGGDSQWEEYWRKTATHFTLPEGITSIQQYAFMNHENLESVEGINEITWIGEYAFYNCKNLVLTELLKFQGAICAATFYGCEKIALTKLNTTKIYSLAFSGCKGLTNITFRSTPMSIASNAFQKCDNLTVINVPWAEGEVANAPWGATNATINYNYKEE